MKILFILLTLISSNSFADISQVGPGQSITSTKFNELISKINELSKKGIQQIEKVSDSTRRTYVLPTTGFGVELTTLRNTITTQVTNSSIKIDLNLFYEADHNIIFKITRTINSGTETELFTNGSQQGIIVAPYDESANDDSTPAQSSVSLIDEPTVPVGSIIIYKIYAKDTYTNEGDPDNIVLNDSLTNDSGEYYEKGYSSSILTEIGL